MAIQMLRKGSKGRDVERWQNFLIGLGHLRGVADGDFGPITEKATKAYQRALGISADGIVGPFTLGQALTQGLALDFEDAVDPGSNPIVSEPSTLAPVTGTKREKMFGKIEFEADPAANNPERIRVTNGWETDSVETVMVPQLKGKRVFGQSSSGRMRFHRKATAQLKALWAAWEEAGLADLILTYEGSYAPRFIRGSRTTLSNHAYASAFDINARWNRLGQIPALEGQTGSVRALAGIANDHGFYWGGHFKNRPDGMHFEVAKLLDLS